MMILHIPYVDLFKEIGTINCVEKKLSKTFTGKIPDGGYVESEQSFNKAIAFNVHVM